MSNLVRCNECGYPLSTAMFVYPTDHEKTGFLCGSCHKDILREMGEDL